MANFWLALCMALPVSASVYSVSRSDGFLREINPADGSTIAVLPMATGAPNLVPVLGANALTQNPITEQIYAAVTFQGNPGPVGNMGGTGGARTLVTLDIVTGSTPHVVVTRVAPLTQKVSSLTFDSTGQLYALSGSGSSTPNTLFRVSTTDGSLTHFFSFTVQNRGGEAIAFNSADGFLYHMAGVFPRVLEVVDLSIPAIVSSFNASIGGATTGMASDGLGGFFLAELFTDKFQIMTTTGVVTNRNTMDHEVTGLLGPLTVPCCVGDEAGFLSSYGTCESCASNCSLVVQITFSFSFVVTCRFTRWPKPCILRRGRKSEQRNASWMYERIRR